MAIRTKPQLIAEFKALFVNNGTGPGGKIRALALWPFLTNLIDSGISVEQVTSILEELLLDDSGRIKEYLLRDKYFAPEYFQEVDRDPEEIQPGEPTTKIILKGALVEWQPGKQYAGTQVYHVQNGTLYIAEAMQDIDDSQIAPVVNTVWWDILFSSGSSSNNGNSDLVYTFSGNSTNTFTLPSEIGAVPYFRVINSTRSIDGFAEDVTINGDQVTLNVTLQPTDRGVIFWRAGEATETPPNETPAAPTLTADDSANTLAASHALGTSEILVSENDSAYGAYTGVISVGDVNRAAGYWKFKTKADTGRNESPVASSPAFNVVGNTTPAAPTITSDDTANTLQATHTLGASEILVSENNAAYGQYDGLVINVGDVNRAEGYWKFKVKSATGRNESAEVSSPAFNAVVNTTPAAPTLTASDSADTLSASHALGVSEILVSVNNAAYTQYDGAVINVGDVARAAGYWKFKIKAATGRNESTVANSPAFTLTIPVGDLILKSGNYSSDASSFYWLDSSGNARPASVTLAAAPTILTNQLNGKSALSFNGSTQFLNNDAFAAAKNAFGANPVFHHFAVLKVDPANTAGYPIMYHTTTTTGSPTLMGSRINGATGAITQFYRGQGIPTTSNSTTAATLVSGYFLKEDRIEGDRFKTYINGVLVKDFQFGDSGTMSFVRMTIGALNRSTLETPYTGQIAEIHEFNNRILSGTDLANLYQYFTTEFNLTITAS